MQSVLAVDTARDLFSLLDPVYGTNERAFGSFFATRLVSSFPSQFYFKRDREKGRPSLPLVLSPKRHKALIVAPKPKLGIDLAERGIEVRKLFYAAFARGLAKDGYDPEEALQEVYRGLLTRNNGSCPFDVRKSSFGHYVHIVTRCILANYIRKERRRAQFESTESAFSFSRAEETGRGFSIEAAPDYRCSNAPDDKSIFDLASSIRSGDRGAKALRLLADGHSKKEVLTRLKAEPKWLDGLLTSARAQLTA
jgi:DNA-directed RNA polymerase specialized sigma24 family protein